MKKNPRITYQKNGPYIVLDVEHLFDSDGTQLKTKQERKLCRCGGSNYKPFCDGSHIDLEFKGDYTNPDQLKKAEPGVVQEITGDPPPQPVIFIEKNGPYKVQGDIEIEAAMIGERSDTQQRTLCRCGGSGIKPYCDGTHQKIGFRDDHLSAIIHVDTVKEELTRVTIGKKELVVVNRETGLSVFSGVCLHAEALLAEGFIEENYLTCGRHRWRYDLETGNLDGDPSMKLKKLKVEIEEGWVLIEKAELNELADLVDD